MKKLFFITVLSLLSQGFLNAQELISLITPHDRDTIQTFYPVLTWNYVNIGQYRDQEYYILTLVEIQEDQSANSAVQVNTPVIRIEGIQGFQFMYPFDAPQLKVNQRYGWRIQRALNGVIVNESEAWEFIIVKEIKVPLKYVKLSLSPQNSVHTITSEGFYFQVLNKYGSTNYKITLLDERGNVVSYNMGDDTKLKSEYELSSTADNCYYLKTSNLASGIYQVKAVDAKGNKFTAKFKVN